MTDLEQADVLLMVAGVLLLGLSLVRWQMSGGHDPLRRAPLRPNELTPLMVWVCLLGFMVGGMVGNAVGWQVVPAGLPEDLRKAWESIIGSLGMQVTTTVVCLAAARAAFVDGWKGWGLRIGAMRAELGWALGGWLIGVSLCGLIAWSTGLLIDLLWPEMKLPAHSVFVTLESPESGEALRVATVLSAMLIAPVCEEFFFRGIVQSAVAKLFTSREGAGYGRWWAIVIAAALFGLMHLNTPQYIPALFVLGMILGYLYERRGSLVTPLLVHVLFNAKSLLWYFLQT